MTSPSKSLPKKDGRPFPHPGWSRPVRVRLGKTGALALALLLAVWLWVATPFAIEPSLLPGPAIFHWGARIAFTLGYGFVAFFLLLGLGITPWSTKWQHRLGFLASASLGLTRWVTLTYSLSGSWDVWIPSSILLMAFLGALSGTIVQVGLFENNQPPSDRVRADVERRHHDLIGKAPPINRSKRAFDLIVSGVGLAFTTPIWLSTAFLVWFEDPGPILFIKNSVGKGGVNFHQYKFRTMISGAEKQTGPVLASEEDERVLVIGSFLRKTALDELPQLINILRGEMSTVGPRPQRTVLVQRYLDEMPEFGERHKVLPGLSGLAQVVGDYYLTPRQKLRLDRLYADHASLGFDLKLLILAFLLVFWFRWKKDWNGRLPRAWMRLGRPREDSTPA
jgi:lipopolysaccharide/colanic/teichoic acid biosynthesis glycosyltransferase